MKLMPLQPGSRGKKYVGGMGEIANAKGRKDEGGINGWGWLECVTIHDGGMSGERV